MIYFSTWMFEESPTDGGFYYQVGGATSSAVKKLIYWRCVLLFFSLAHQQTAGRDDVQLCLFTNVSDLPSVDGVDLRSYLNELDVKIIRLDYCWRPQFPSRAWYNQFYVFDILDYFEVHATEADHFIIADSDCLVVDDLSPLFDRLIADGYLAIDVETTPDEDINGISRRQAASLYGALGGSKQPLIAPYFGGEFFGISGTRLGPALAFSRDGFQLNNRRAMSGMPYLTEEAHLLSFACVQIDILVPNANEFLRRIWTTWKANNTRSADLSLLIWHVPGEKIFGIRTLAHRLASTVRKGKRAPLFTKSVLSRRLGVGKRRVMKLAWTLAYAVFRRAYERLFHPKGIQIGAKRNAV